MHSATPPLVPAFFAKLVPGCPGCRGPHWVERRRDFLLVACRRCRGERFVRRRFGALATWEGCPCCNPSGEGLPAWW